MGALALALTRRLITPCTTSLRWQKSWWSVTYVQMNLQGRNFPVWLGMKKFPWFPLPLTCPLLVGLGQNLSCRPPPPGRNVRVM